MISVFIMPVARLLGTASNLIGDIKIFEEKMYTQEKRVVLRMGKRTKEVTFLKK